MSPATTTHPKNVRVLLVEDELDDALAVTRALPEAQGFQVVHVRSGAEAVEASREGPFDAALIDHRLTDLSGVEVCRTLRRNGFRGPLLLLSSVAQDEVIGKAYAAGADEFLLKEADYGDRLREALRLALDG